MFENPHALPDAKMVYIIMGYKIEDDRDYNTLFHCAQFFAGSSGDKSFERALSNHLIPLHIPHPSDLKTMFMYTLMDVNPLVSKLYSQVQASSFFTDHYITSSQRLQLIDSCAKSIDVDFFNKWKEFCEQLKKDHNLHDKFTDIVQEHFGLKNKSRLSL